MVVGIVLPTHVEKRSARRQPPEAAVLEFVGSSPRLAAGYIASDGSMDASIGSESHRGDDQHRALQNQIRADAFELGKKGRARWRVTWGSSWPQP